MKKVDNMELSKWGIFILGLMIGGSVSFVVAGILGEFRRIDKLRDTGE
ncbi:MAG: hypothetical protein WC390_08520 [Sulfurimonas sp.]